MEKDLMKEVDRLEKLLTLEADRLEKKDKILKALCAERAKELMFLTQADKQNRRLWSHLEAAREMERVIKYILSKEKELVDANLGDIYEAAKFSDDFNKQRRWIVWETQDGQ